MVVNNSGQGALGAGTGNATIADPTQQPSGFGQIIGGIGDIFGGLMGAGQQFVSSPNALMGLAGGLLTKEAYDRLSDIGAQAKSEAMGIAERGQAESQFRPFTVTTPTGAMFTTRMGGQPTMPRQTMPVTSPGGFAPSPTAPPSMMLPISDIRNSISSDVFPTTYEKGGLPEESNIGPFIKQLQEAQRASSNPFTTPGPMGYMEAMAEPMQAPVAQAPTTPTMPAPFRPSGDPVGEFLPTTPAGEGLEIGMTLSPEEQALQRQLLGGAGGFFGQAMQPTVGREQTVFERIRAAQRPEEERQRLALEERLAAQGRLGTSSAAFGGATPELMAQQTAIGEARNRAMLSAMQQAQAEQAQQAALGGQFLGAGYLPTQQLVAATQPGLIQQELAQQAQQFGTGLFGETALSGIEAQLLAEQARANLLGGIGSNVISGLINQQRAASAAPSGGSSLGGLFSSIAGGLGSIGGGIADILGI